MDVGAKNLTHFCQKKGSFSYNYVKLLKASLVQRPSSFIRLSDFGEEEEVKEQEEEEGKDEREEEKKEENRQNTVGLPVTATADVQTFGQSVA